MISVDKAVPNVRGSLSPRVRAHAHEAGHERADRPEHEAGGRREILEDCDQDDQHEPRAQFTAPPPKRIESRAICNG